MPKRKTVLSIIAVAVLMISVVAGTYAFFTANSTPVESSQATITTGSLTLILDDAANKGLTTGGAITPNNLSYTTYLSIRNDSPIDVYARILFQGLTNTYSEYLVYSLEQVDSNNASLSPANVIKDKVRVPASASASNQELANGLNITAGQTQYYKVTIEYLYSQTEDQSSDLNKTFYTGFTIEEGTEDKTLLADYLVNTVYKSQQGNADPVGNNAAGLYYHSSTCTNGCAQDGAYRYAGAGGISCTYNSSGYPTSCNYSSNLDLVNNWVCFGTSDASTCKSDTSLNNKSAYLYRIMGVYEDKVKLIKADSIGDMSWDRDEYDTSTLSSNINDYKLTMLYNNMDEIIGKVSGDAGSNDWTQADLKYYLNNEYYNSINNEWKLKIASSTWYIGGYSSDYVTPKVFYDAEFRGTCSSSGTCPGTTLTNTKVGLMNVSEYGYSASSNYWSKQFFNSQGENYDYRGATAYNWLYQGVNEWTMSPYSSDVYFAWNISSSGALSNNYDVSSDYAVRPVFYLSSSVEYVSGTGTYADPYIIG